MSKELLRLKKTFERKITVLEQARIQLKKEFVGIDEVIDEIIENVRSWFTLGDLQTKPCIINLWGLTGVGKSSLLLRLSHLLEISEKTFRIDLGEKKGQYSLNASLEEISDVSNNEPVLIILDEIQHARTLMGGIVKQEVEKDPNRIIWELIDSGMITVNQWSFGIKSLMDYMQLLSNLINNGMRIRNGLVISKKQQFLKEICDFAPSHERSSEENSNQMLAIHPGFYRLILDNLDERHEIKFLDQIEKYLKSLDEAETLQFLYRVIRKGKQPLTKYFKKALIFVVGNVDEAYRFNGDFSADISANEFYELSKKINVPIIKLALRERFRDEQIARLGNTHIIYPALNEKAYQDLIRLHLNQYFEQLEEVYKIKWTYNTTLVDKVYREGVYPTQGARPVFTTIQQLIKAKTALFFQVILMKEQPVDTIQLNVQNDKLVGSYYFEGQFLWDDTHDIPSQLESLRNPKKDERQAITAVHESGHAVLLGALLKSAPKCIRSVTSDANNDGFVLSKSKTNYTPKHELIRSVAVKLGGLVAEKLIFGEDHITLGSSTDITNMQEYLDKAFKHSGIGKKTYAYASSSNDKSPFIHTVREVEQEIKSLIDDGKALAEKTLLREKRVLVKLAKELSLKAQVDQEEFIELYNKYAKVPVDFDEQSTYYRDQIENALIETNDNSAIVKHRLIILNKQNASSDNFPNSSINPENKNCSH